MLYTEAGVGLHLRMSYSQQLADHGLCRSGYKALLEHGSGAQNQEARAYRPAVHVKLRKALATAADNKLR